MPLVHDKGINEYAPVRKAYDRAKEILNSDKPDEKELSDIVKQFDSHPEAVEWLRLEEEGRFEDVYSRLCSVINPKKKDKILATFEYSFKFHLSKCISDWEQCAYFLEKNNLEIITARQLAELRMEHGKDSTYCREETWVGEAFVYQPDGSLLIVPKESNLLLANAKEARNLEKIGAEFMLPHEGYLRTLDTCLFLSRRNIPDKIRVEDFGSNPVTCFLFKDLAADYGKFLKKIGLKGIALSTCSERYARKQNHNFIRSMWMDHVKTYVYRGNHPFSYVVGSKKYGNSLLNNLGSVLGYPMSSRGKNENTSP